MITDPTKQTADAVAAPAAPNNGLKALTTPAAPATPGATKPTGLGAALKTAPAAAPALNDSVADKVKALTSQDSPLMQQAKTDGLKVANRRGLLNSSMAAGASQDAMVRAATPIAQQDAAQSFQKNMQTSDQAWRSGESALDRGLQEKMQSADIDAQKQAQLRDIASREGLAAAERALQELMQGRDITSREGMATADRASNEAIQKANRELEERMQSTAISAQERQQIRDISSREGMAAAERALQEVMQGRSNALQWETQSREIGFQTAQRQLDRNLQEQIASWNLKASDRNAAAQFVTNMEGMFQDSYSSIMANTNLDAASREAQIVSARALRDRQMNLVQQMYGVSLTW